MKTVIIGLGNPILRDDGAGIRAARLLEKRLSGEADVKELYAGGIRLVDEMAGYERAIIIDSMLTGSEPGTVHIFLATDLLNTRNTSSSHDSSLLTALETGRALGIDLPTDIEIIGIEAEDVETFGEELTEKVEKAVDKVVEMVAEHA